MNLGFLALLCVALAASTYADDDPIDIAALRQEISSLAEELKKTKEESKKVNTRLGELTRQMILQQLSVEERIRSEGQSGITQTRNDEAWGIKTGSSIVPIRDLPGNIRLVGSVEYFAVVNAFYFHVFRGDYQLSMPSRNTSEYHMTEDIPFPDVPPEVTSKKSLFEKGVEMVEWFKAWKNEDHSQRDYRKYFKPVLCYLEGTWINGSKNSDESFDSYRHFVDARSWFDLQEKIRYTSYSGRKDLPENSAYLPTKWNYRILCHPLKDYLPVNRFRIVDDLAYRLSHKLTIEELSRSPAARFQLNPKDTDDWQEGRQSEEFGLLDKLMGEIPGKDNYPADIVDEGLGQEAYSMDPEKDGQKLNAGYYHRLYKLGEKARIHRAFSDPSLFVAMTTQPNVAGLKANVCSRNGKTCTKYEQKVSYAIPLEIIYLTPLNKWNPYNLTYKGHDLDRTVKADGRNGGKTKEKAYDGVSSQTYYVTPDAFFEGMDKIHGDAADTSRDSVGVLGPDGELRFAQSSGTRIFLPSISEVGILRTRYPIMPLHVEGSTTYKKTQAIEYLLTAEDLFMVVAEQRSGNNDLR